VLYLALRVLKYVNETLRNGTPLETTATCSDKLRTLTRSTLLSEELSWSKLHKVGPPSGWELTR